MKKRPRPQQDVTPSHHQPLNSVTPATNSTRFSIKKSPITENQRSKKLTKKQIFFKILNLLLIAASNVSELPITSLADILPLAEAMKTTGNDRHDLKAFQNTTERLMAQIYADIHAASAPGVSGQSIKYTAWESKGSVGEASICCNAKLESIDIVKKDWIRSNLKLQIQAMFKVIEYALAASELTVNPLTNDIYETVKATQTQSDQLDRALPFSKLELVQCARYASFAAERGWMMLSILANSAAFREAARTLNDSSWGRLQECISLNFDSLEYFAKIRGLDWRTALTRVPEFSAHVQTHLNERHQVPPPRRATGSFAKVQTRPKKGQFQVLVDHPNDFIVPEKSMPLQRPRHENQDQVTITDCSYSECRFLLSEAPASWPTRKPYPSDPTITDKACQICKKIDCACHPMNCPKVLRPLVEIRHYGSKGVGIRALEPLYPRDLLDEYVGEIYPAEYANDPVYAMGVNLGKGDIFALISSKHYGNWTRFLNHSCDPNTNFCCVSMGGKSRVMIKATKEIRIFEEITVDYGNDYFTSGRITCQCGSSKCRFSGSSKKK